MTVTRPSAPSVKSVVQNPAWASLPLFDRTGWRRVRFGDVVENCNETCEPEEAGLERYVAMEHLEPGSLHVRSWGNVADGTTFTRRCRPGQVLFGKRRAYQRKVAVSEFEAVVSGDIYVLAPKDTQRLLPELLPFLCLSERFFQHAVGTSAGSLSPRTNWSSLASFEFDLPPLDQQRRIAEILWAVDEVIVGYEQLVHQIGLDIASKRHRFFSGKSSFRTHKVGELFDVQLGKMLSQKARTGEGAFRYLGNKNVQWGYFDFSEMLEMDFSPDERRKFSLREGDLLVCEGGEVGRSAIWRSDFGECYYQKAIHRLRPLSDAITTPYMLEFLYWANEKGLFSSLTGHSTIAHLPVVKLKSIQVPVASAERQREFVYEMERAGDGLAASKHHTDCIRNVLQSFLTTIIP
jgi:type I restriction enzyme S subunit